MYRVNLDLIKECTGEAREPCSLNVKFVCDDLDPQHSYIN